jgi:hypothetical protein
MKITHYKILITHHQSTNYKVQGTKYMFFSINHCIKSTVVNYDSQIFLVAK